MSSKQKRFRDLGIEPRRVLIWALVMLCVGVFAFAFLRFFSSLDARVNVAGFDPRPILVAVGMVASSVVTYLAWPSRWNIVAHGQLVFSVIAYIVPLAGIGVQSSFSQDAVGLYYKVAIAGAVATIVGAVGGLPLGRRVVRLKVDWLGDEGGLNRWRRKRVAIAIVCALLGMALCFFLLGFVPALAADPFSAKFFKGTYAATYASVAPLYRTSTTVITLMIPLVAAYFWQRHNVVWGILLVLCLLVMALTLQRGPAVTGILLFVGVLAAAKRHRMGPYFLALILVYLAGSAVYSLVGAFGVSAYAGSAASSSTFWENVAAGAPDVVDQLNFLEAWLASPEFTHGLTFVGGLVPGNFYWNPAVWGLSVTNPGADISDIASGGYRLPPALWGYVSFGSAGVLGVGFVFGFLSSWIAGYARQVISRTTLESAVSDYVTYGAVLSIATSFYALSYLHVVNIAVVAILLWPRRDKSGDKLRPGTDVSSGLGDLHGSWGNESLR